MTRQVLPEFRRARVCACGDHGFVALTRAAVAFVDAADVPLIGGRVWSLTGNKGIKYAETRQCRMHRLLTGVSGGFVVDHKDGNGLNNRRANLRICTRAENSRNSKPKWNRASKFKGITKNKTRWCATIKLNRRIIHLGYHDSEESAARQYDKAALELHGEFALTNVMLGLLPEALP